MTAMLFLVLLLLPAAACFGQETTRPISDTVVLPRPIEQGQVSLEQLLGMHTGDLSMSAVPLSLKQTGQMLWAGAGAAGQRAGLRMVPVETAQYPLRLYAVNESGVFAYDPDEHNLERINSEDIRGRLVTAALGRKIISDAPCSIVLAAFTRGLRATYGPKAETYLLLEAGHIARNIQLQATAMGLVTAEVGSFDTGGVSRLCRLPKNVEPLLIICAGRPTGDRSLEQADEPVRKTPKRVLMIVASEKFRDEEMFHTQYALERAQFQTSVASTVLGEVRGMLGGRAEATVLLQNIDVGAYDAIVFVGGSAAQRYFTDPIALDIARRAAALKKVVAAISTAPTILANAGLLAGVRVTAFPTERQVLRDAGAVYTGEAVERAGRIITARAPETARQFGRAIVEALERQD